jgi:hypothetical protein
LHLQYSPSSGADQTGSWRDGMKIELGAVNLFDQTPQFSGYLFNLVGYDPAQGDIRGRFVYAQVGVNF